MSSIDPTYVVVDLETTGLHPNRDTILEIAAIHIDFVTLQEYATFHDVVHFEPNEEVIDGVVMEMHKDNGLWEECSQSMLSSNQLYRRFVAWLKGCAQDTPIILCGNSVQFDQGFLKAWHQELRELLHYRCVDVRTLILAAEHWSVKPLGTEAPDAVAHRALKDCWYSLACMREFRERLL